jgi:hypothetical protein
MRKALLSFLLLLSPVIAFAAGTPSETPKVIVGHLRREPVLPLHLPDYELIELDIHKEAVFHVGNQTFIGRIPVLAYVPITRTGRATAVDRLIEARKILITSAASSRVTTADLAAIRDEIEQALDDLRADSSIEAPAPAAAK